MTTTMLYSFEEARASINRGRSSALMLTSDDVDAMSEPDWRTLREEAREYGLELEVDDDGDAIARAR